MATAKKTATKKAPAAKAAEAKPAARKGSKKAAEAPAQRLRIKVRDALDATSSAATDNGTEVGQLAVDARSLKGSALSGQLKTSGLVALTGGFRTGAPSGRFDALRLPGLALTTQTPGNAI